MFDCSDKCPTVLLLFEHNSEIVFVLEQIPISCCVFEHNPYIVVLFEQHPLI